MVTIEIKKKQTVSSEENFPGSEGGDKDLQRHWVIKRAPIPTSKSYGNQGMVEKTNNQERTKFRLGQENDGNGR